MGILTADAYDCGEGDFGLIVVAGPLWGGKVYGNVGRYCGNGVYVLVIIKG